MKRILLLIAVLAGGAGIYGYMQYNKPHEDLGNATSDLTVKAETIYAAFSTDETAANAKYLDKVIELQGTVATTSTNESGEVSVNLVSGEDGSFVTCALDGLNYKPKASDYAVGQKVKFKGKCAGKLMDVQFNECVPIK